MPDIGLILTSAPSVAWIRDQMAAARATALKVIPAWGLAGGWTPAAIAEVAALPRTLVVRTSWGDPSYDPPRRRYPEAGPILDELAPWLAARPDAWVEIGNEPLLDHQPDELEAWRYRWHLAETISAIRARHPRARLIAPAHLRNHPLRLGHAADGQGRWDAICAEQYRRCDALGLHAYTTAQADAGLRQLRQLVSGSMPIWLTEFALGESLAPAARGERYRAVLDDLPVAAALVYHLDALGGSDPAHFRPEYRLAPATLAALAAPPAPAPTPPDTAHFPEVRVPDFAVDVRQWRTPAALRRHLAGHAYRATAPWAKGVVIHHTYRPLPRDWRGPASLQDLAEFYRYEVSNGAGQPKGGWTSGPHLFLVVGAPNPALDGIWQLTPLNEPGTHARAANASRWGLEHVGDFTRAPMPAALAALSHGATAALLDWAGLPTTAETITPHAQWGKPACPGRAVSMAAYRSAVAALRGGR